MYNEKVCCTCKVAVLIISLIVVFLPFSFTSPLSIIWFYILFEQIMKIIESFAFSPAKSVYYLMSVRSLYEYMLSSYNILFTAFTSFRSTHKGSFILLAICITYRLLKLKLSIWIPYDHFLRARSSTSSASLILKARVYIFDSSNITFL